jgi:TIR domain
MSFDVFISYTSKDKMVADATCASLEAAQIRCWIAPRDILPGADWGASIIDALDHCRVMVLIFSASANESAQIRNEVVRAVQHGVPVIPVRIEDITPAKSLAYFMGAVHWLDALSPPLDYTSNA